MHRDRRRREEWAERRRLRSQPCPLSPPTGESVKTLSLPAPAAPVSISSASPPAQPACYCGNVPKPTVRLLPSAARQRYELKSGLFCQLFRSHNHCLHRQNHFRRLLLLSPLSRYPLHHPTATPLC